MNKASAGAIQLKLLVARTLYNVFVSSNTIHFTWLDGDNTFYYIDCMMHAYISSFKC